MRRAVIAAIIVSLVSGFYNFFIQTPLTLNPNSPSFAVYETFFYAPKVTNPFHQPGELVPAGLMWLLAKLTGSVVNAFIAADFIFPSVTFLALFLLTRSILISLSVLVFYHYLTYFPYLPSVIRLFFHYFQSGSYWPLIRGFHPQISLGLWFIFMRRPNWLTLTLLTYTDFFFWTMGFIWLVFRHYFRPLIYWLVLTLPYWINIISLLPAADYWQRNYYFVLPTVNQFLVLTFGLNLALWQKRWRGFYMGVIVLVAAASIFKFGPDDPIGHWFLRVVNPMTALLLFTVLFKYLKWPKLLRLALITGLLLFQFRLHWQYFHHNAAAFTIEPERVQAFTWLKQNTLTGSIVAADMKNSLYLPTYTHNQPYLKQAQLSQADNHEILRRFLEIYKIKGVDITTLFTDNRELIAQKRFDFDQCAGHFLFFRLYNQTNYYSCTLPASVLEEILTQYQQTPAGLTYPADYWMGTEPIDFGILLWENQTYKVYDLR